MSELDSKLSSTEGSESPSVSGNGGGKNFSRTPTSWDAQDDILLMHLKDQQKLGWKEIASHFTNRTPNACQFRWRRLKSGNLKNPPKSASALGPQMGSMGGNGGMVKNKKTGKSGSPVSEFSSGINAYSPLMSGSFTGYDNNVNSALAGLNALSNTPSNISSPLPAYQNSGTSNSTPSLEPRKRNSMQEFEGSDVILDPKVQSNSSNTSGGYYAEIPVDPTMNLPHNQPHPHAGQRANSLTPRNSTSRSVLGPSTTSYNTNSNGPFPMHNNSIIQIVKDDRASVSSITRASVSSLPSKSMHIPHHQLHSTSLAHLPILFGGSSIGGPSRQPSFSGAGGMLPGNHSSTIPSLRSGSTGSLGYYSRSGSVIIPQNGEKKDEDKADNKSHDREDAKLDVYKQKTQKDKSKSGGGQQVLRIPWSMEEDELLINRRHRELSFAELSILLPQRTEGEIWARIDYLDKLRNGHRSSTMRDPRWNRRLSIGLDEVDDLYNDVNDVINSIDSDDEEVNSEIEGFGEANLMRGKKRRTSSAVNPLAVGDSIRRKLK